VRVSQHLADAVFEGGGVKAIGLVGALEVMESAGYAWNLVAGASAGAIVAALVAAGYRSAELAEILDGLDFRRFKDEGALDAIPLLGKPVSFLFEKGVYEGRALEAWVGEMLAARGVRVFGDLHAPRGSAYEHRLQVLVSDVTEGRILVAPSGLEHYGLDPDAFPVARAVRMSASIPFFFEPVVESGHYFVDGGLLSNFPVWLFDREPAARSRREPVPRWPTFGFKLVGPEEGRAQPIGSLLDYVRALVETMLESHDKRHIEDFDALRTILVPTAGVRTTDFGLAPARRAELYEAGRRAALAFQAGWDAEDYVRAARRPTTATGRAARERYRERVSRRSARMIGARAYRR
jgi:NTE family protein